MLSPIFEADFSGSSYGFRPGKNAHQAVKVAQQYKAEGRRVVVVDMDLEKFFDRVNHDLLMAKLTPRVGDGRVLSLIRWYLEAGMMAEGIVSSMAHEPPVRWCGRTAEVTPPPTRSGRSLGDGHE